MDISFSGAGFMGTYYFGVVDCWRKYVPRERVNRVAGASAGSLIAAYYLMDLPLEPCLKEIVNLTEDIRSRTLGVFDRSNQIVDLLPKLLDRIFPEDAHKRVSGRLFICMTRLKDMKKIIVSEFETRQDLIDALNCSCFIPVWSGNHVSTYKGIKHIDGGFSDNLPVFDEHTIRVCCFAGPSDVAPYDKQTYEKLSTSIQNTPLYLNLNNMRRARRALFPPPPSFILELLERGFHDVKQFILSNDLIQCESCYKSYGLEDTSIYHKYKPSLNREPEDSSSMSLGSLSQSPSQSRSPSSQSSSSQSPSRDENGNELNRIIDNNNKTLTTTTTIIEDGNIQLDEVYNKLQQEQHPSLSGSLTDLSSMPNLLQRRRATIQSDLPLLKMPDKFRAMDEALPSCPPSPNLDRHCVECIALRQAARNDRLEECVRQVAHRIVREQQQEKAEARAAAGGRRGSKKLLTRGLTSPIRWLKQMGTKSQNSYTFEEVAEEGQQQEDGQQQPKECHSDEEDFVSQRDRQRFAPHRNLLERRRATLAQL